MANLTDVPEWEEGIYQIEKTDRVLGGPGGPMNKQAQQLGNRTAYLKEQIEATNEALTEHKEAEDPYPQYVTQQEMTDYVGTVVVQGQVNADWNATEGAAEIKNKPELHAVATSGNYEDLTNKPDDKLAQVDTNTSDIASIKSGYTKTDFSNVTGEAKALMANMWVPSSIERTTLTFPAKGDGSLGYQAPTDGWFYIYVNAPMQIALYTYEDANKVNSILGVSHTSTGTSWSSSAFVPVAKGHYVVPWFPNPITADRKFFVFIKARGAALAEQAKK